MTNMYDYIKWRADITFDEVGINEVDSLIFTELSYIPFEDIVSDLSSNEKMTISEIGKKFFEMHDENISIGAIIPSKEIVGLLKAVMDTPRFKDVKAWGYVNDIDLKNQCQFCAICFDIGDKLTYVAYRGTDDTLIGWKENFNMAFFTPIPSQKYGAEYLNRVAQRTKGKLFLGGHSKGGNLAVYSALFAAEKVKKRIDCVHNFDGPGFQEDFIKSLEGNPTVSKIITIVPENSTVGMIFDAVGELKAIKSSQKGLRQHDAFSWGIMGSKLIPASLGKGAKDFHDLLKKWVKKMTREEKIDLVEALYKIFTVTDATTLTEISADKMKFLLAMFKADEKTKKTIINGVRNLIKEKYSKKPHSAVLKYVEHETEDADKPDKK